MADGRASMELLKELYHECLASLLRTIKGAKRPSAEYLQVTRKFLKDGGQFYPPDEASRKRLEKLQRLYLQALVDAFEVGAPPPTAALLGEARQFLAFAGCTPDLPARAAGITAQELLSMEVPFTTTKQ